MYALMSKLHKTFVVYSSAYN